MIFTTFIILFILVLFILYKEMRSFPSPKEFNPKINISAPQLNHYYVDYREPKYLKKEKYLFDKNDIPIFVINGKEYYH